MADKYKQRLKNNELRVIQHSREKDSETCHCRVCNFSGAGSAMLSKAKKHARETGHTIDVYYETWREVTYYNRKTK